MKVDFSYLSKYYLTRQKWAKCYSMNYFTCGISTTQRVESINSVMSKYLSSKSSLQEVFIRMKNREFEVDKNIIDEKDTITKEISSKNFDKLHVFIE